MVQFIVHMTESQGKISRLSEKLLLAASASSKTAESMVNNIGLAKRYKLPGIPLWRPGIITRDMWQIIERHIKQNNLAAMYGGFVFYHLS